ALKRHRQSQSANYFSDSSNSSSVDLWAQGVEKVKADRGDSSGGAAVIPPELQHYSDRHWFLATQVADVRKNNVATVQGFVDLAALKKRDRAKQRELQKEISTREQQLKSLGEDKALLDQFYGRPDSRQKLFSDYESLQTLAKNFDGRSYNIDDAVDREAMKLN